MMDSPTLGPNGSPRHDARGVFFLNAAYGDTCAAISAPSFSIARTISN